MKYLKVTSVVLSVAMCMSMIAPVSVLADETAAPSETQTEETVKPEPKETEKPKPSETEKQMTEETVKQEPEETEKAKPAETSKEEPAQTEPEASAETEKQEPSETEPEAPVETEKQVPSETEPETSAETEKQEPETTESQEPAETKETIPEVTEKPIQETEVKKEAKDGSCGNGVNWSLSNGTLTISGSGDMSYSGYYAPWFSDADSIKKVEIQSGVTSIRSNAFESHKNLTNVTIASSVKSIGTMAFSNCTSLSSVSLPSGLTAISGNLFSGCKSLKSISIPSTVKSIGFSAFYDCALTSVSIPSGVTEISSSAFQGCPLTSVSIPSSVTDISDYAFAGGKFSSITLPSNLEQIGEYAFSDCTALTAITIPSAVKYFQAGAFSGCTKLKQVTIQSVQIGSIPFEAFMNCSSLTSVNIPEYVDYIGGDAFNGCTSLTKITIPSDVRTIEPRAFKGCKNLTEINIPKGVKDVNDSIFEGCTSLKSIKLPDGVTRIGHYAFQGCTSLSSIDIPDTVTNIWRNAFNGCTSLAVVNYSGSEANWNSIEIYTGNEPLLKATLNTSVITNFGGASGTCGSGLKWTLSSSGVLKITGSGDMDNFDKSSYGTYYFYEAPWNQYKTKITSVELPSGLTSIGNGAFSGCSNLTSISIPSSVTSIGKGAFTNTGITSLTIPSKVTKIVDCAFEGCTSLTSVTIPSSVTSIGKNAFTGSGLKKVTIPSSVSTIGESAFKECANLTSVTINKGVTSIGKAAFRDCTNLATVSIPDSVTTIGNGAFRASGLTSVTIPGSVTSMDYYAFSDCASLTTVTIKSGVTSISSNAFTACINLTSVTIPLSVDTIGSYAFSGCVKLTDIYYEGTEGNWDNISLNGSGHDQLYIATKHYGGSGATLYTIKVVSIRGKGEVTLSATSAEAGTKITVNATPAEGYYLGSIAVDGTNISGNSFVLEAHNTEVEVKFYQSQYTVNVTSTAGGTASCIHKTAGVGDNITIDYSVNTGYELGSITVNGKAINGDSFTMPACNVDVVVTFTQGQYTVTVSVPDGGGTASATPSKAGAGEKITVSTSPSKGYEVDTIKVDGKAISGSTFTMPASNVNVIVSFKRSVYKITLNPVSGGSATLSKTSAYYGEKITVTATPASGYALDYIKVGTTELTGDSFYMSAGDVTVTVSFKKVQYAITATVDGEGGTVSTNPTKAGIGDNVTITATPSKGYSVDTIKVNNKAISGTTFTMTAQNTTVVVTFKKASYKITVSKPVNGSATASQEYANYGDKITITATPATGYVLDTITANGTVLTSNTFSMSAADVTVEVTFKKATYTISAVIGEGGSATIKPTKAQYGDTITVTTTPSKGYELDTIKVNGKAISGDTFTMPAQNTEVDISFKKSTYKITISPTTNGSASASQYTANYGDKITITATPDAGYTLDTITANGTVLTSNTFSMSAADVTVEVTFKKATYNVSVTAGEGGSATANPAKAQYGASVTVTATPSKGYMLDTIKVDGKAISGDTFTMPAHNAEVEVTFKKATYKITVSKPVNGSATASQNYANYGDKITITATPATGYTLDTITANGTVLTSNTFSMSAADVTVEVTFKKATYTISAVIGEGGSATIKPTKAQYGDTVTVTATPSKGYALDTIKVNGKAISGDTFTMPAQNTEVDISFKKLTYKINVAKPVNGSVSVSATTATYGEKITVTATPATGYAVNTIKVNDTTLTGNTFNMSAADVTVEVTFKKVQYTVTVKYSAGGTATADVAKAGYGDMVSLTFKPNTGYEIEYVTVNDENSEQVFTMPAENVTVYVKFKKIDYTITVGRVTNGTASVDKEVANYGDKVTVTATPATGYTLDVIKVNGTPITGNTFTMENRWTTVEVFFKLKDYKVNLKTGTGGTATVNKTTANMGDSISVTFVSDPGYQLDKITVNGNPSSSAFLMGASDVDVMVTFKKITYKISLTVGSNGTAKLSQTTAVVDDEITVETTPVENYYAIIKVGDDVIVGNTFKMPPMNVTVKVTFDKVKPLDVGETATVGNGEYTVTAAAPENGTGTVRLDKINDDGSKAVKVPDTVDIKGVTYRVTAIGNNAMAGNPTMTSLYIGSYVTVIGSKACYGCKALVKVSGGLRLKTIGNIAFGGCAKLSTFVITSAVLAKISPYTFYADKSLKTIYVNKTTKLSKAGVKKSLKSSSVKTVKVKKSKVKKYKKIFKKKNCGRKVKVKK